MQRIFWWAVFIALLAWIVTNPTSAGSTIHNWFAGLGSFFGNLLKG